MEPLPPAATPATANSVGLPLRIIRHGTRWVEEFPASPLRWLLIPAWLPWRLLIALRGVLYDRGLKPARHLGVPVISIGNLTAGGTGKTPAALAVVAHLRKTGWKPAILSRGYRGVNGINDEALLAGDTPVVCDPDRHAGGQRAIEAGADCVVLDDGFQHRQLHRDIDIVVIDATQPWGNLHGGRGAVLPLGYLREGRSALRRAQLLWLTRVDLISEARLLQLRAALAGGAPLIEERSQRISLRPLTRSDSEPISAWKGRLVVLVSGIGNPAAFELTARTYGLVPLESHRFPDHHHFTAAEADALMAVAKHLQAPLVMTGKDAVKLRAFPAVIGYVLEVESALVHPAILTAALTAALGSKASAEPSAENTASRTGNSPPPTA